MTYIEWTDDLLLGIDEIDQNHQYLIHIINELGLAIHIQDKKKAIVMLRKVRDFMLNSFIVEEQLLQEANYEHAKEHHLLHENFKKRADRIRLELHEGKDPLMISRKTHVWLISWIILHIKREDRQYAATVKKHLNQGTGFFDMLLKPLRQPQSRL